MKNTTLFAAAGLIVLSNAVALWHAARNRAGVPEAEIVLTDRELYYYEEPEDSGVSLTMNCLDPDLTYYGSGSGNEDGAPHWLDAQKLAEIGFDVNVPADDVHANGRYSRQVPRTAFVALEYDGPAWRAWADARRKIEDADSKPEARRNPESKRNLEEEIAASSRFVLIDAGSDAAALRARHPDRHVVVIAPAVIAIQIQPGSPAHDGLAAKPARVTGSVREVQREVHVPKPFSAGFHDLDHTHGEADKEKPLYRVHLSYGSLLEPWVTAVEFRGQTAPR